MPTDSSTTTRIEAARPQPALADMPMGPAALAKVIRREATAWVTCVLATLEYYRTTAEIPDGVLETLRPFRHGLDEAVQTGRVLQDLAGPQLAPLATEITSLDHEEVRRCARELIVTQRVTTSLGPTLTAALLRGLRSAP
jgi:hypothetical protein